MSSLAWPTASRTWIQGTLASTTDHLNIGSVSKAVTGSLIALFVAKGVVQYGTTVGAVFPELAKKYPNSPLLRATLLQLLTHTSGLPHATAGLRDYSKSGISYRLDMVEAALRLNTLPEPGTISQYSNPGVCIAAAMVEKASGRPFESWLEGPEGRQIGLFSPRMLDSFDLKEPTTASPHYLVDGRPRLTLLKEMHGQYLSEPSGGCSVCLEDLSRFIEFTASNYEALPTAIFDKVVTPSASDPKQHTATAWAWHGNSYLTIAGNTVRGEYCMIRVSPKLHLGMVFYANATPMDVEATDGPDGIMTKINTDMANFLRDM